MALAADRDPGPFEILVPAGERGHEIGRRECEQEVSSMSKRTTASSSLAALTIVTIIAIIPLIYNDVRKLLFNRQRNRDRALSDPIATITNGQL